MTLPQDRWDRDFGSGSNLDQALQNQDRADRLDRVTPLPDGDRKPLSPASKGCGLLDEEATIKVMIEAQIARGMEEVAHA